MKYKTWSKIYVFLTFVVGCFFVFYLFSYHLIKAIIAALLLNVCVITFYGNYILSMKEETE